MSSSDSNGWTTVSSHKKKSSKPVIIASLHEQEQYKQSKIDENDNHDTRFDNVVLTKKKVISGKVTKVASQYGGKNTQQKSDIDERKLEDENYKLPYASGELSKYIAQARQAKNMTQDQLDQACSFSKGTVKKYESKTAVVNNNELMKMSKVLGVTLKK